MNRNKNKRFITNNEASKASFKRSQFVMLMFVCLIAIVAFTIINIESTSADNVKKTLFETPQRPFGPTNLTEIQYCDSCHTNEMPDTWITVTVDSETTSEITYSVTGSDIFDGEEGWAVFDPQQNNIDNAFNSGTFTLSKDGKTYRVFWVDNGTGGTGEGGGGSAFTDILTPNDPPTDPDIDGPKSGSVGQSLKYNFSSTDSQEDKIYYYIKWGDGTVEDWFGAYNSGQIATKSHSWSDTGTYTIEIKARDEHGAESNWSPYDVEITTEPELKIRLKVFSIGKVCATITNTGAGNLSDVNWNVTVKGGIFRLFKRINANASGIIDSLGEGEKQVVCTPGKSIILRFGLAKVTVTVTIGENTYNYKQLVLVIGRLIFARPRLLGI